jgi:hypothetical protein
MSHSLRTALLIGIAVSACSCGSSSSPSPGKITRSDEAWRRDVERLKNVCKDLNRAEFVVFRSSRDGLKRIGPICVTDEESLTLLREWFLGLKNVRPYEGEQYATENGAEITLVYHDVHQVPVTVVDATAVTFFEQRTTAATIDYEFDRFLQALADKHAAAHPEDVLSRKPVAR